MIPCDRILSLQLGLGTLHPTILWNLSNMIKTLHEANISSSKLKIYCVNNFIQ